ncbi:aminoglycoside 6'-N-acetyltransferase [Microvirga puerhi]|uniref:Aminoglycoside N(6')-acetyltransferase type 1 n=1 Tax=Microvirga puerhi TaxID=2876078 RepID=A0ABS7VIF6_9HYPH|nr:aminoglycoside 6'-N-acetyltransferase [Microvirga puerhi]MBZ6074941.1 GNAT family N-acetyltransferase [Microvirga puerhi]
MSKNDAVRIVTADISLLEDWTRLRAALWPESSREDHHREAEEFLLTPSSDAVVLLALADGSRTAGFVEVALRRDYVNGCVSSPVAFLEGIYVDRNWRRGGIARLLVKAAEAWAMERGCSEFASDADLGNTVSHAMHERLGFEETERVVYFRKQLASPADR